MTPWSLNATGRISQISQSGCALHKGTRLIMASCMAHQHLQEKVLLRYDITCDIDFTNRNVVFRWQQKQCSQINREPPMC